MFTICQAVFSPHECAAIQANLNQFSSKISWNTVPSALLSSKYVISSIFPSHIYIRMSGEGNFQRHAYLSMEPINFNLQFHFNLQRHLGIWFPLLSCYDLEKIMLASKKRNYICKSSVSLPKLSLFSAFPAIRRKWTTGRSWNCFSPN